MTYTIDVKATSSAPPEVVFEHLAVAEAWSAWGRFPTKSVQERAGENTPHGVGAIRRIWPAREQVVAFEAPKHFAYVALSGLPAKDYRSDVTLEPSGDGGTAIRWQGRFEQKFPGSGPPMRAFLNLLLSTFARQVARHSEQCRPGCPAYRSA